MTTDPGDIDGPTAPMRIIGALSARWTLTDPTPGDYGLPPDAAEPHGCRRVRPQGPVTRGVH